MSEPSHRDQRKPDAAAYEAGPNFIHDIIDEDRRLGRHAGKVHTRFPPEPNGYLHIGHAKSICLNFGTAQKYGGLCNLRFDDTNPTTEDPEYVEAIQRDVHWLGFDWQDRRYYASDYFEQLYAYAEMLIQKDKAYVDSQSAEAIAQQRGDFYRPGQDSPFRNRPVAESLDLFRRMRAGEFEDGSHVLRAKIDMRSGNLNLRDPVLYRIRRESHYRTGDRWPIYPMYDYAHALSDALEGITHSVCTLEFEDHRPLYEWCLAQLPVPSQPQQIEFARLNLTYTVMSKRKFLQLVESKRVDGWDDPRMPTLAGLRRRGFTPEAIRAFCDRIGVGKRDGIVDVALLEYFVREDLNARANRAMAVLRPLRVVVENLPEGQVEWFEAQNHPEYPERGTRKVPFSRVLYIEQDDFREQPPKKWFRLAPGGEVRLRYACLLRCREVVKDPTSGAIVELRCTWDPDSRGGTPKDGRKVKGTLHWVSAEHAVDAEVRLYDRLFSVENPNDADELVNVLNPNSLEAIEGAKLEPSLADAEGPFQFERLGYFCPDSRASAAGRRIWNRTIELRDSWAKIEEKQRGQ
ncbi:MAG TPA: glutamine--tRNA ligase/YqeY domain fusion protein [Polyangiales bacterium]|nr:glutamine--tRNA ligase/YqeY domain fusion protein [Polyangiales bacterium]